MRTTAPSRFPVRPAIRLTVLVSVQDRVRHRSLEMELLRRARKAHLAGVTVFEGDQGYGASGQLHRTHLLSDDRPLAVVLVGEAATLESFLDDVSGMLAGVLVTIDEIEVVEL